MLFPLSKITNPGNTTQFKLVQDSISKRVNDLLINSTISTTLYGKLLTFRDTNKKFELMGDLLKMITNKNYKVDLASSSDKILMYNFAKEMYFDVNATGVKSTRDRTLIKLLESPGLIHSASGVSSSPKKYLH